jgi:hypothetical protein
MFAVDCVPCQLIFIGRLVRRHIKPPQTNNFQQAFTPINTHPLYEEINYLLDGINTSPSYVATHPASALCFYDSLTCGKEIHSSRSDGRLSNVCNLPQNRRIRYEALHLAGRSAPLRSRTAVPSNSSSYYILQRPSYRDSEDSVTRWVLLVGTLYQVDPLFVLGRRTLVLLGSIFAFPAIYRSGAVLRISPTFG